MAYRKTGRARETKTRTKVLIAVVLAVALLAAGIAVFAAKDPRAAMKLVLSDQDYAGYVLQKNVKDAEAMYRPFLERWSENTAFETAGQGTVELSKDMQEALGSDEVLTTAQRYLEQLTFTANTQVRGLHFSNELKLNDPRQTIFTHDLAYLASGGYSCVPEYGYGWTRVFGKDRTRSPDKLRQQRVVQSVLTSRNETVKDALTKSAKAGYKAVKKDVQVTIDEDKSIDFQDKHATGDRVNLVLSRDDMFTFLDSFFEKLADQRGLREAVNKGLDTDDGFASDEAFRDFLFDYKDALRKDLTDAGVRNVSVDLEVDQKNTIHAFDALVKRADGDIIVNAMLRDDEGRGPAFQLRAGGDTLLKFNVEKSSKTAGTVDFTLGGLENTLTYTDLQTADGMVFGTFAFDPVKLSGSEDLGLFGLHLTLTPSAATDGTQTGFHVLAQTGFSTVGTATINAEVTEAEYTGMLTEEDIVLHKEYKAKEKKARRVQYWLVDLPEADSRYNNALKRIVQSILEDAEEAVTAAKATENETLSAGA